LSKFRFGKAPGDGLRTIRTSASERARTININEHPGNGLRKVRCSEAPRDRLRKIRISDGLNKIRFIKAPGDGL